MCLRLSLTQFTYEEGRLAELQLRSIRLKEWGRNVDTFKSPSPAQIAKGDTALREGPFRFRTDERGYIITGNESIAGAKEMVCLGDSFLECMFVDEESRLCSAIERALRSDGRSFNVLNAGASGATSLTLFNLMMNKCVRENPALVILFNGVMELDAIFDPDGYWSQQAFITPMSDPHAAPTGARLPEPEWSAKERILNMFQAASQAFGFQLALATSCHRRRNDAYMERTTEAWWFDGVYEMREKSNGVVRSFAERNGILLLDVEAEFNDPGSLMYDDIHLGAEGALSVGRWIAQSLKEAMQDG